jgi:spoIIIJ-associated protein
VEWVETTGKTIEEAKESALDQLGVDEPEAEFEVLEEAKRGLFGRVRREARVRARVRPRAPRPKVERRRPARGERRPRGKKGAPPAGEGQREGRPPAKRKAPAKRAKKAPSKAAANEAPAASAGANGDAQGGSSSEAAPAAEPRKRTPRARRPKTTPTSSSPKTPTRSPKAGEENPMSEPVSVQEQGQMVRAFLEGLADAFDTDAEAVVTAIDDDTIEVALDGDDLGVMIGPKGQTLQAIQELSRASVQRSADGPLEGRVRIDIGAYRLRRREALERFARQQADEVLDAGVERALEPMSPADRKVVHDTVNDIPGVRTVSEGEDARRRVVIIPD